MRENMPLVVICKDLSNLFIYRLCFKGRLRLGLPGYQKFAVVCNGYVLNALQMSARAREISRINTINKET